MIFQKQSQYPIKLSDKETALFTCHHYINKQHDEKLVSKLSNGSLFQFENQHTKEKIGIPYPCLFEDEENKFLVFFIPNNSVPLSTLSAQLFEGATNDYSDYTLRLTTHVTEFLEKISILESSYRDTEIECVKVLTHTLLEEQQDDKILALYFYIENNTPGIMCITDKGTLTTEYRSELVDVIEKKLGEQLNLPKNKIIQVNGDWAIDMLDLR